MLGRVLTPLHHVGLMHIITELSSVNLRERICVATLMGIPMWPRGQIRSTDCEVSSSKAMICSITAVDVDEVLLIALRVEKLSVKMVIRSV